MLKNIDPLLNGELLRSLDQMGHGDELVVADRNFPAYSFGAPVIRIACMSSANLLDAILSVFPLDTFVDSPLQAMGPEGNPTLENRTHLAVLEIARKREGRELVLSPVARHDFYRRSERAALIVQSIEPEPYCDFILTKGVV